MLAQTNSVALVGAHAVLVRVEVDVGSGIPAFAIVGLPARSVREAEQRTRAALMSSNEDWPQKRKTINLAPGALRKEGTHFDLAIALGIVAGAERLDRAALEGWVFVGELALDGGIRSVRGALPAAIACREAGLRGVMCPAANAGEAAVVKGIEVVPLTGLDECLGILRGSATPQPVEVVEQDTSVSALDIRDVRGHAIAKEALAVAAAGGHNLLLVGPPGSGKTMLAHRLPGILPSMSREECIDVTRVHSVAGLLPEKIALVQRRPFRSPHHHISLAGLVGGGSGIARPGEVSLAHHGALFLDEIALYRREVLDALRGPLEDGVVRIARSTGTVGYPCRFTLVAAMNPCPCGYLGDRRRSCACRELDLQRYRAKISGPLIDRIDIQIGMRRLGKGELLGGATGEDASTVRARVERVRSIQALRYGSPLTTNASAPKHVLDEAVPLSTTSRAFLESAVDNLSLTGRGVTRVMRIARTIADFEESADVHEEHLSRALMLRLMDGHEGVAA